MFSVALKQMLETGVFAAFPPAQTPATILDESFIVTDKASLYFVVIAGLPIPEFLTILRANANKITPQTLDHFVKAIARLYLQYRLSEHAEVAIRFAIELMLDKFPDCHLHFSTLHAVLSRIYHAADRREEAKVEADLMTKTFDLALNDPGVPPPLSGWKPVANPAIFQVTVSNPSKFTGNAKPQQLLDSEEADVPIAPMQIADPSANPIPSITNGPNDTESSGSDSPGGGADGKEEQEKGNGSLLTLMAEKERWAVLRRCLENVLSDSIAGELVQAATEFGHHSDGQSSGGRPAATSKKGGAAVERNPVAALFEPDVQPLDGSTRQEPSAKVNQMLTSLSEYTQALAQIGHTLLAIEDGSNAEPYLDKARKLAALVRSSAVRCLVMDGYGAFLGREGRFKEALTALQAAIFFGCQTASIHNCTALTRMFTNAAQYHFCLGEPSKAEEMLRAAVCTSEFISPRDIGAITESLAGLVAALLLTENIEEARVCMKRITKLLPAEHPIHRNMTRCLAGAGHRRQFRLNFELGFRQYAACSASIGTCVHANGACPCCCGHQAAGGGQVTPSPFQLPCGAIAAPLPPGVLPSPACSSLPMLPTISCRVCNRTEGEDGSALLKCSRCHEVVYCSRACQKKDWESHKKQCVKK